MGEIREGGCLCGAVRYRAEGPFGDIQVCHCTECERTSGGPAPYTSCDGSGFTLLSGDDALTWFAGPTSEAGTERGSCTRCGSTVFARYAGDATVYLLTGSLDDASGIALAGHIFWDSRQPWERPDGAATFPGYLE